MNGSICSGHAINDPVVLYSYVLSRATVQRLRCHPIVVTAACSQHGRTFSIILPWNSSTIYSTLYNKDISLLFFSLGSLVFLFIGNPHTWSSLPSSVCRVVALFGRELQCQSAYYLDVYQASWCLKSEHKSMPGTRGSISTGEHRGARQSTGRATESADLILIRMKQVWASTAGGSHSPHSFQPRLMPRHFRSCSRPRLLAWMRHR